MNDAQMLAMVALMDTAEADLQPGNDGATLLLGGHGWLQGCPAPKATTPQTELPDDGV